MQDWRPGKTLLEDYVVEDYLGRGAMGIVYLVRRKRDGEPFAVKTLHEKAIADSEVKRSLFNELRMWIDLPEHPHLTACRFFRTVEDRMAIFAEYVDGGSLKGWIQQGKLTDLRNVLDIAIQFAWGLQAAHECGVVHMDVKPANVLISKDGNVKVTDFGLSRARGLQVRGAASAENGESSPLVSSRGMTVAYCSPEQSRYEKLDHRTDVWSWGLSILEIFTGKVTWNFGPEAASILEEFLALQSESSSLYMPDDFADILRKCFRLDVKERWDNFLEATEVLKALYAKKYGSSYSRIYHSVDSGNTVKKIVHDRITIHGGRWRDPQYWLRRALEKAGRPAWEAELHFSARQGSRKAQSIEDFEKFEDADEIYRILIESGREEVEEEFCEFLQDKAWAQIGMDDAPGALQTFDRLIEHRNKTTLKSDEPAFAQKKALAAAYAHKASLLHSMCRYFDAVTCFTAGITIWQGVKMNDPRDKNAEYELPLAIMNRAVSLNKMRKIEQAEQDFDLSISLFQKLNTKYQGRYKKQLALAFMNKSLLMSERGKLDEAAELCRTSVQLFKAVVKQNRTDENMNFLGRLYLNWGVLNNSAGNPVFALSLYDNSLGIWNYLINKAGRIQYRHIKGILHSNKASALKSLKRYQEANREIDQAVQILDTIINKEDQREFELEFARVLEEKSEILEAMKKYKEALAESQKALEIIERLREKKDRSDLTKYAVDYKHRWIRILESMNRKDEARRILNEIVDELKNLIEGSESDAYYERLLKELKAKLEMRR